MSVIDKYRPTLTEVDLFEERAAIVEYEGNTTKEEAERQALKEFIIRRKGNA